MAICFFAQETESLKLEMEELQKEVETYEEQIKTVEETIAQFEEQIKDLADKSQTTKVQIKAHQSIEWVSNKATCIRILEKNLIFIRLGNLI